MKLLPIDALHINHLGLETLGADRGRVHTMGPSTDPSVQYIPIAGTEPLPAKNFGIYRSEHPVADGYDWVMMRQNSKNHTSCRCVCVMRTGVLPQEIRSISHKRDTRYKIFSGCRAV